MLKAAQLLVTGASGYLGSSLLNHLWQEPEFLVGSFKDIYLLDRKLKFDRFDNDLLKAIKSPKTRMQIASIDLANPGSIDVLARKLDDEILCLHTAYTADLAAEKSFLEKLPDSTYMVYFSTAAVYGESMGLSNESDEAKPINDYGRTKLELENFVQEKFSKHLILRIANPFGEEPDERGVVRIFANKIIDNAEIKVFADNAEQVIRDFVYIEDFNQAIASLIKKQASGIYNIASGQATSLGELIATQAFRYGKEPNVSYQGSRAGEIQRSVLDISKLQASLPELKLRTIKDFKNRLQSSLT